MFFLFLRYSKNMDSAEIKARKKVLRLEIKQKLNEFSKSSAEFKEKSEAACLNFLNTEEYKICELLLCFISLNDEINTDLILKTALLQKKTVAVPRVISATEMDFFLLKNELPLENQLTKGSFGILEPAGFLEKISPDFLGTKKTVTLLPGLAFDKTGFRLGRGKGYYDRYLSRTGNAIDLPLSGFCFDFQLVESVPHDEHDFPVWQIITESGVHIAKQKSF